MSGIDLGVWLTISGLLIGVYVTLTKRQDTQNDKLTDRIKETEDCVEDKLGEVAIQFAFFKDQQHEFQTKVLERLSAIETHLKGGLNPKRR